MNRLAYDPTCRLYLPLWMKDGATFMSDDAYGHLVTATGSIWGLQGRNFDGDDFLDVPDNDVLSFGDSLTDSPFSMASWVYINNSNRSDPITKGTTTAREYMLVVDATTRIVNFLCYDEIGSVNIGKSTDAGIANNAWSLIGGTYDGSSSANGVTIYVNNTVPAQTNVINGVYVAMHNQGSLRIGRFMDSASYTTGKIGELLVLGRQLRPAEIERYYEETKWRWQ